MIEKSSLYKLVYLFSKYCTTDIREAVLPSPIITHPTIINLPGGHHPLNVNKLILKHFSELKYILAYPVFGNQPFTDTLK
jgi:hypothetical protein